MWFGNTWWFICNLHRPLMKLLISRPDVAHLPLEQSAVCNNVGFMTHRNNEFMFLMLGKLDPSLTPASPSPPLCIRALASQQCGALSLRLSLSLSLSLSVCVWVGETVLQIIVSEGGGGLTVAKSSATHLSSLFSYSSAVAAAGYVVALTLMFSFRDVVVQQLTMHASANEDVASVTRDHNKIKEGFRSAVRVSCGEGLKSVFSKSREARRRLCPRSAPLSLSQDSSPSPRPLCRIPNGLSVPQHTPSIPPTRAWVGGAS